MPKDFLHDLRAVGPEKPLGYLPVNTIVSVCQMPLVQMINELEQKQLVTRLFSEKESRIFSGALYAYDEPSLQALLNRNRGQLVRAHWPFESDLFVERVAKISVSVASPVFDIIADAFADYRNRLRILR